ncbi:hypothetical protein THRCLA_07719 [Thraustotheca clavata]|uniref:FYVE-type domain-containing protein n=1 Tax=Thraustotheca clavata TaxID=74557 RepID=A0A1V9ZC85_9STRA|nr:hypothetical protein THRCLA_07719 [Thraustotheca clavata]
MASLPPRYFHCPPLSPTLEEEWMAIAQSASQDTVVNAMQLQMNKIHKVCTHSATGIQARIFKGTDALDRSIPGVLASTQLHDTNLNAIAAFFEFQSMVDRKVFHMTNGQTLYTLVEKTDDQPLHYVALHWMACSTPIPGVSIRDYCVLEYQDEFIYFDEALQKDRRGWLRCLHSIETTTCPSLKHSHGLIRGELFRSGHIFIETETPGVLDYHNVVCTKYHGSLPQFLVQPSMVWQVSQVFALQEYLEPPNEVRESSQIFKIKKKQQFCKRCNAKFTLFSRSRRCSYCHELHCKRCCHTRDGDGRICRSCESPDFPTPHREMSFCVEKARSEYLRATQGTDRSTASSSMQGSFIADLTNANNDIAYAEPNPSDQHEFSIEGTFTFHASSRSLVIQKEPAIDDQWTTSCTGEEEDDNFPMLQSDNIWRTASDRGANLFVLYEDPRRQSDSFDESLGTAKLALKSRRSRQFYNYLRAKFEAEHGCERKKIIQQLCSDLLRQSDCVPKKV